MADTISEKEVLIFIDKLFAGKFNSKSKLVKDWIKNGDMEMYAHYHSIDSDNVFFYVIISCFVLERYDVVLYFINKDKTRFTEDIFSTCYDFDEGLAFCINNGVTVDYEDLFYNLCQSSCINCLKYLVGVRNFKLEKDSLYGGEGYPQTVCSCISKEYIENGIKTITYLINDLGYDINLEDEDDRTCLEIALS